MTRIVVVMDDARVVKTASHRRDPATCGLLGGHLGQGSEVALRVLVPTHSRDGSLPPALHLLKSGLVGGVARCDHLLEMGVVRFDDVVGGLTFVGEVARPTELSACHLLHGVLIPFA